MKPVIDFYSCSNCGRTLNIQDKELWSDTSKRICKCCECFKYPTITEAIDKIASCRRTDCPLYKYHDWDFISLDGQKLSPIDKFETKETYNLDNNTCIFCKKDILYEEIAYNFNAKISMFTDNIMSSKTRHKFKVCVTCFNKHFDCLPKELKENVEDVETVVE